MLLSLSSTMKKDPIVNKQVTVKKVDKTEINSPGEINTNGSGCS